MLDNLGNTIINVAEEFIRRYADRIKGEIDPEDVRKLTPEQQGRLKVIMGLAENFGAIDEYLQVTVLKQSVKSMIAINKMRDIPAKVDAMFKGEATLDELERMILAIPEERLLETNDIDGITVYNEYCKSVYRLALYANFIGRTKLLYVPEIQRIVRDMAEKEAHEIYGEPNLEPELRDAVARTEGKPVIPYGLRQAIIKADSSKDKNAYLDSELLQELYAHKAEIVYGNVSKELGEKLKKIGVTKKEIIINKKTIRRKLASAVLYTTMTAAVIVWPFYNAIRMVRKYKKNDLYKPSITMDGQTEATEYDAGELEFISAEEARNIYNSEENEKRFVTEFNTRPENKVEVKVYDYTDSDMSDEELKSTNLDDEKLVYHRTFDKAADEIQNSEENFAGEFTGHSSRSVSKIKFGMSLPDKISHRLQLILSMAVVLSGVSCLGKEDKEGFASILLEKMIDGVGDTIGSVADQVHLRGQLRTLSKEAAPLERQAKLESLQEDRLKAIAERNKVDEELENYNVHPVR